MEQAAKNVFQEGLNTDIEKNTRPASTFFDCNAVRIFTDGSFTAVSNMESSLLETIVVESPNYFESVGHISVGLRKLDGTYQDGNFVFTFESENLQDYFFCCYFVSNGESLPVFKLSSNKKDDKKINSHIRKYSENGIDCVYFTNGYDMPGRLFADESKYGHSFGDPRIEDSKSFILTIEKKLPSAAIPELEVVSGGQLFNGAYQIAYRLTNSETFFTTKWSLINGPMYVTGLYQDSKSNFLFPEGGVSIGGNSGKAIKVSFSVNEEELSLYDSFQIAVIPNITGTGIPSVEARATGFIKNISSNVEYKYTGSEKEEEIAIEDLTIETAPIAASRSLHITSNTLMLGGITYKNLKNDRGEVEISKEGTGAIYDMVDSDFSVPSFPFQFNPDIYEDENIASKFKSYFRGETYRFAISYFDSNGHFSSPKVIDFSGTEGNENGIDYTFGERSVYPVKSAAGIVVPLGMQVAGIKNHPTWAKGFVMLRAKRKKKIQFQTLLLPTEVVQTAMTIVGSNTTKPYPGQGETLPNTNGIIVPKNMRNPLARHIQRNERTLDFTPDISNPNAKIYKEEVGYYYDWEEIDELNAPQRRDSLDISVLFPDAFIYSNGLSKFGQIKSVEGSLLKTVDMCYGLSFVDDELYNGTFFSSSNGSTDTGNYMQTEAGVYIELTKDYSNIEGGSLQFPIESPIKMNSVIREYHEIENFGSGVPLSSAKKESEFGNYQSMEGSLKEGFTPDNMRMSVIVTRDDIGDIAYYNVSGDDRFPGPFNGRVPRLNAFRSDFNNDFDLIPLFPTRDKSNSYKSEYNSFARIVNIESNVSSNRYGSKDDFNEFIFTGYCRLLTPEEINQNLPVTAKFYGGDCFIGKHYFKVCNSSYSIVDVENSNQDRGTSRNVILEKWGRDFENDNEVKKAVRRAIPVKQNSVVVSCYLESEVNPCFTQKYVEIREGGVKHNRQPFTYNYNFDYSIEPVNKVWVTKSPFEINQLELPATIHYSKKKIRRSSDDGISVLPVLNIHDLDERNGAINGIYSAGRGTVALQSNAVVYIPIEESIIETSDASTIAVRSNEFIGRESVISTSFGMSTSNSAASAADTLCFYDRVSNSINMVSESVASISEGKIRTLLSLYKDARSFTMAYDRKSKEVVCIIDLGSSSDIVIYNVNAQAFVKTTVDSRAMSCSFDGNTSTISIVCQNGDKLELHQMYLGTGFGSILSTETDQYIEFTCNQEYELAKVFDNLVVHSSNPPVGYRFRTSDHLDQESVFESSGKHQEGSFRLPVMPDGLRRRMRGLSLDVKIDITSGIKTLLSSCITKYRKSFNYW